MHLCITPLVTFLVVDEVFEMTDDDFGLGLQSLRSDRRLAEDNDCDSGDSGIGDGVELVEEVDKIRGIEGAQTMSSWSMCSSMRRFSFSSSEASMVVVLSLPWDSRRVRRSRAPFASVMVGTGFEALGLTFSLRTCEPKIDTIVMYLFEY